MVSHCPFTGIILMIEDRRKCHNLDQCHLCMTDWVSHQMKLTGKRGFIFAVYTRSPYYLQTQFNEVFEEIWLLGTSLSRSSSFQPGHEIWKIFKINLSRGIQRFTCLNVDMTTLTLLGDAEYKSKSNQSHKTFQIFFAIPFNLQNTLKF